MRKIKINKEFGSIMVMVPHSDDEILLTAGILANAVASNLEVTVVIVTNGDYGSEDESIGRLRLRETIEGMRVLGIKEEQIEFLGYADTGMAKEESFLYRLYWEKEGDKIVSSYRKNHTYGLPEKAEYHYRKKQEHASYTRNNVLHDVQEIINEYKPNHIFTTALDDLHGDHSGLYLFVTEALRNLYQEKREQQPCLYSGIVHSVAGDEQWPSRSLEIEDFCCPSHFDSLCSVNWEDRICFPVTQEMRTPFLEENKKAIALSKHVTALKADAAEYLYSFLKTEEIFWQVNVKSC